MARDAVVRCVNTLELLPSHPVADRGLHAYVVPSARAGQQTDPAARRDALSGLISGGFLLGVIAVALAIILVAPQYSEPVAGAMLLADESPEASLVALGEEAVVLEPEVMTSKPPDKLRGYRWPVRGGSIDTWYEPHRKGDFEIAGERIHDGLVITWFEGAAVKAAHKGTVVAAGRDWARHVGFDGPLDVVYERYAPIKDLKKAKSSKKPRFPEGIVIDDGNGYYSVYTEVKDLRVKPGDAVTAGQPIAGMAKAEGKLMMRYRLVRMDGPLMKVDESARQRGYPYYARERIDPTAVLELEAKRMPKVKRPRPEDPPRLSEY